MDETRGFKVADDAPAIPPTDIPDATRQQLVKMVAAIITGATPEEIARCREDGEWPEVVDELLDRAGEADEVSAHVDLLVVALDPSAAA